MHWVHLLAYLLAGAFFANFVPHFVSGVLGRAFPTPFASPPFRGLSSSINVGALAHLGRESEAVHVGKTDVGEDDVRAPSLEHFQRRARAVSEADVMPERVEEHPEHLGRILVVLHDQDALALMGQNADMRACGLLSARGQR